MSVKVYDNNSNTFEHDHGTVVEVEGGHLLVRNGNRGQVVAVYAPGSWVRAESST